MDFGVAAAPVDGGVDCDAQRMGNSEGVRFLLKVEVGDVQGERGDSRSSCEPGAPATADEVEDEVPVFPAGEVER